MGREVSAQPPWSMQTSTSTDPGRILLTRSRLISLGARLPGISTEPTTRSASETSVIDGAGLRITGLETAAENIVQIAQAIQVDIHNRDVRAQSQRHFGRFGADRAGTENHHLARHDARYPAQQHAAAAMIHLQADRARLNRDPARDLGHRGEQGQAALCVGDGFIGDADDLSFHQLARQFGIGGEVQVGEEDLAFPE